MIPNEIRASQNFVLPHFSCDVISAAKLIAKSLATLVENDATNAPERLSSLELKLCAHVIGLD